MSDYAKWKDGDIEQSLHWQRLQDNLLLSLIKKMLTHSASKRYTMKQLLNHLWVKKKFKDSGMSYCSQPNLDPSILRWLNLGGYFEFGQNEIIVHQLFTFGWKVDTQFFEDGTKLKTLRHLATFSFFLLLHCTKNHHPFKLYRYFIFIISLCVYIDFWFWIVVYIINTICSNFLIELNLSKKKLSFPFMKKKKKKSIGKK